MRYNHKSNKKILKNVLNIFESMLVYDRQIAMIRISRSWICGGMEEGQTTLVRRVLPAQRTLDARATLVTQRCQWIHNVQVIHLNSVRKNQTAVSLLKRKLT